MTMGCLRYDSPLGPLTMVSDGQALTALRFGLPEEEECPDAVLLDTGNWLSRYFAGDPLPVSAIPMAPAGTAFQQLVWKLLLQIPCGETVTYGALAREAAVLLGKPAMSAQAVGGAVGKNPIAILIPCHRVMGKNGSLTGYAYGIDKKACLLRHEEKMLPATRFSYDCNSRN